MKNSAQERPAYHRRRRRQTVIPMMSNAIRMGTSHPEKRIERQSSEKRRMKVAMGQPMVWRRILTTDLGALAGFSSVMASPLRPGCGWESMVLGGDLEGVNSGWSR